MFKVIAENINVMSKRIGPAMRNREAKPIQELAERLTEAGADLLDINLGPARKSGDELMRWVVGLVQEVSDLPLFFDTMNVDAMESGLKVYKPRRGKAVINSVMARDDRMDALIPMALRYGAGMVALLWGPDGIPRDENERGELAANIVYRAQDEGMDSQDIFVDPIVVPISSQQIEAQGCTSFMAMLKDIFPECESTCGLSNISNGCPEHLRPLVNQTYFAILRRHGLSTAILDPLDKGLMDLARGKRQDIEVLVARVMENEPVELSSLSKEERDYVKT
ncbi:MAG: dihydropteroate synthase, partial [Polyangia bacterium]|nr:dihydropteroate synthase [Polyangia bacterium]